MIPPVMLRVVAASRERPTHRDPKTKAQSAAIGRAILALSEPGSKSLRNQPPLEVNLREISMSVVPLGHCSCGLAGFCRADDLAYCRSLCVDATLACARQLARGSPTFCPMVRKTSDVSEAFKVDIQSLLNDLARAFGEDVLMRSAVWMTLRETYCGHTTASVNSGAMKAPSGS